MPKVRSAVATDDFNRASLGTDWEQTNPLAGSIAINASTEFYGPNALGDDNRQSARWVGAGTFEDDQYSEVTITLLENLDTDYGVGVCARMSAETDGSRDHYSAFVCSGAGPTYTTNFGKILNGAYTSFTSSAVAWSVGDKISIECEGTTIRLCKNGTAIGGSFTVTDSSLTTGVPGIQASGANTVARGDNWEGGSLIDEAGQFLAPVQDISSGPWLPSAGSPAELWQMLDGDKSPDDDYCYTTSAGEMEVKFSPGSTPTVQTGHKVRYRLRGNGSTDALVKLKQGSTVIAQWTETNVPDVDTDYERTLDASPSFTITDYSDLRLSVEAIP